MCPKFFPFLTVYSYILSKYPQLFLALQHSCTLIHHWQFISSSSYVLFIYIFYLVSATAITETQGCLSK